MNEHNNLEVLQNILAQLHNVFDELSRDLNGLQVSHDSLDGCGVPARILQVPSHYLFDLHVMVRIFV